MSILVNENTRLLVQGITGKIGSFQTRECMSYGTNVVAGVTPGKGGQDFDGVPIFNTVCDACDQTHPNTSFILVPPKFAADAIMEAAVAGVKLIVCITELVPIHDMMKVISFLKQFDCRLVGPNCPGVLSPGKCKVGIIPAFIHTEGSIGVISRSGSLLYSAVDQLTQIGLGQSTSVGIGGDPIIGSSFLDIIKLFNHDPNTKGIVLIGEVGGNMETVAAEYIKSYVDKPVIGYVAGHTAPKGKRMGHAGALVSNSGETAREKTITMCKCGIHMVEYLDDIGKVAEKIFKGE